MIAALASSQHLLIVDNCEHLVASVAPLIGKLLAQSPRLRVLVTSREPLHVIGERVHRVAPLDTGSERVGEPVAVTLFLERARAAAGIPLAIELAAAQVGVLSIAAIADRLERRLGIPGDAYRVGRSQRTTVRASIDWSYELLEPIEQTLFRRLAVFSGGFTLEAVETIVADTPFEQVDVLDLVSRLADKSMIVAEPSRERFRMLETIREYALEKLDAAGERARYVAQHAAYYLDYAERHGNRLRGPEYFDAYTSMRAEIGNLRDALDETWAVLDRDERALRGLAAMMEYWWTSGSLAEGRARIAAFQQLSLPPSATLAMIYFSAAEIAISESAFAVAGLFAAMATAASAEAPAVLALNATATELFADILEKRPVSDDRMMTIRRLAEELGEPSVLLTVATAQGFAAKVRDDAPGAQERFEEALAFAHQTGDPTEIAATSLTFARMCLIQSEPFRAARLLAEAIPILAQRDHLTALGTAVDGLAMIAASSGANESAAFFLGAGRRLHRASGVSGISTLAPPVPDSVSVTIRETLGDEAFERFQSMGERAHLDDIVDAVRTFIAALPN
jgi:non-specific serine/threonine protein kinase